MRDRIEQEVAEDTETMVHSPLFSPFPPVRLFLRVANSPRSIVRGKILRCQSNSAILLECTCFDGARPLDSDDHRHLRYPFLGTGAEISVH